LAECGESFGFRGVGVERAQQRQIGIRAGAGEQPGKSKGDEKQKKGAHVDNMPENRALETTQDRISVCLPGRPSG
jgi:hypothetical protein